MNTENPIFQNQSLPPYTPKPLHLYTLNPMIPRFSLLLCFTIFLMSCDTPTKQYDTVPDFCNFVFTAFKTNAIDESANIWVSEEEIRLLLVQQHPTPNSEKEKQLEQFERMQKLKVFDVDSLQKAFRTFRNTETNEFWQQLRFDSVDYRIENWKGIELTEATAFVSYQNQTFRLKIGELIKTPHGWKIMVQRGPWWK